MAARNGPTSQKVPILDISNEENHRDAKTREILGKELKDYIISLSNNLYRQPPNKSESELLHKLFKKQKFNQEKYITIQETMTNHNTIMHRQNK